MFRFLQVAVINELFADTLLCMAMLDSDGPDLRCSGETRQVSVMTKARLWSSLCCSLAVAKLPAMRMFRCV